MRNSTRVLRLAIVAGLAVIGTGALAGGAMKPLDTKIVIDKAVDSPTLTIRYSGANAVLVELRVNGVSMGTRSVSPSRREGETNFTLNLAELKEGENEVEVRLFDKSGKLLGSEKTSVAMEDATKGAIYLTTPKVGSHVQGTVEIKVGFGRELSEPFVSFFVDNAFKSMSNFPPFTFVWDTTREANGWHEVEAWVVDKTSATHKTRKVRVFVNNPGGATMRATPATAAPAAPPKAPVVKPPVKPAAAKPAVVKPAAPKGLPKPQIVKPPLTNVSTAGSVLQKAAVGKPVRNPGRTNPLGAASGLKPSGPVAMVATGPKHLTPTGTRVGGTPPKAPVAKPGVAATSPRLTIEKGTRLPDLGRFAVLLNGSYVTFDVAPRVDNGVPMTPVRHLLEKGGAKVDWEHATKSVRADADGKKLFLRIGDPNAKVDSIAISLEVAPYIDGNRTIVPLSFLREALGLEVEFDRETGHVLITTVKKIQG